MVDIGRFGVWEGGFRGDDAGALKEAAAEVEELGYGALWLPGLVGGDVFGAARRLLEATRHVAVAIGIVNIWKHTPDETASHRADLEAARPGRFLLGLGVSHALLIDADEPGRYRRPMAKMVAYLERLDAGAPAVPKQERVLAALGPKMLELARDRSGGAHPFNGTPEHTRRAREILGDGPILAPEQAGILETDPARAREMAREYLAFYLGLPNYVNNWRRLGFTEDDVSGGPSDRLVDAVVAWGSADDVARRLREHLDAGADHVCVQVFGGAFDPRAPLPRAGWRELAAALGLN